MTPADRDHTRQTRKGAKPARKGTSIPRMTIRFASLLLALSIASPAGAQSVENQIRAEVARYVAAINRGDVRAVAGLYLNEARTSTIGDGEIHRGWDQIARLLRDVYAQAGTIRMTSDSVAVFPLGAGAAIATLRYTWTIGGSNPEPATGAMTLVYTRTRQGWRVAHDHTSTLQPATPAHGSLTSVADSGPTSPRRSTSECTVKRITDGDGIECEGIGRVRLIGMDTPELDQKPFGRQAAAALGSLVRVGARVRIEQDVDARDRNGRLLAYVWVGRVLVNWRMVREGWATLLTYQPNVQYVDWLIDAERRARAEGRGLWGTGGFECLPRDHRGGRCE